MSQAWRIKECQFENMASNCAKRTLAQKFSSFWNLFGKKKHELLHEVRGRSSCMRKIMPRGDAPLQDIIHALLGSLPFPFLSSFLQEYYFRLRCLVVKVVLPATQQCYTQWYGSIHLTRRAKQQVYVLLWIAYRKIVNTEKYLVLWSMY